MRARSRMASHQAVGGVAGESGNGRGCQPDAGAANVVVVGCRVWVVMGVVYKIRIWGARSGAARADAPHPRPLSPLTRGEGSEGRAVFCLGGVGGLKRENAKGRKARKI